MEKSFVPSDENPKSSWLNLLANPESLKTLLSQNVAKPRRQFSHLLRMNWARDRIPSRIAAFSQQLSTTASGTIEPNDLAVHSSLSLLASIARLDRRGQERKTLKEQSKRDKNAAAGDFNFLSTSLMALHEEFTASTRNSKFPKVNSSDDRPQTRQHAFALTGNGL